MSHETRRHRVLDWGLGALVLALVLACLLAIPVPTPDAFPSLASRDRELPAPRIAQEWSMVPMTGGPAVYTSCVGNDRLYALNKMAWRSTAGLWPDAALAVAPGACRGSRPR